jgi:hypothetical protein
LIDIANPEIQSPSIVATVSRKQLEEILHQVELEPTFDHFAG